MSTHGLEFADEATSRTQRIPKNGKLLDIYLETLEAVCFPCASEHSRVLRFILPGNVSLKLKGLACSVDYCDRTAGTVLSGASLSWRDPRR